MRNLWCLFLFFMFFNITNAQSLPEIKINSDQVHYFGDKNKVAFRNNVVAISSIYTLTADSLDVFFNDNNIITKIGSIGNVSFKSSDLFVISNKAELDQLKKIIIMEGSIKAWHKDNYIEGEQVTINYETQEFHLDKGDKERVTIIFKTDDEGIR